MRMAREEFIIEKKTEKRTVVQCNGQSVAIDRITFACGSFTHQLCWRVGKKRLRRAYKEEAVAIERAKDVLRNLFTARGDATQVDPDTLIYLVECQKKLGATPLHEAVNFYLRNKQAHTNGKTVAEVVRELMLRKQNDASLGSRYMMTLKTRLRLFLEEFAVRKIVSIRSSELQDFLDGMQCAGKTKSNIFGAVSLVFSHGKRQGYFPKGEDLATAEVEQPRVRFSTPEVFTPAELMGILKIARPEEIAYLTISAFAGGRRAEVERLSYEDIDFEERIIRMNTEITKTGQRRTLEIPDNLYEWLLPLRGKTGPLVQERNPLRRLRLVLGDGWNWKSNGLRHSFISYHLAKNKNAPWTAELAGNSVRMINAHYKSLVTRSSAEEWFTISPIKLDI